MPKELHLVVLGSRSLSGQIKHDINDAVDRICTVNVVMKVTVKDITVQHRYCLCLLISSEAQGLLSDANRMTEKSYSCDTLFQ